MSVNCTMTGNGCNNICNNKCNIVTSPICNNCNLGGSNTENYVQVTNGGILIGWVTVVYSYQGKTFTFNSGNLLLGQNYKVPLPQGIDSVSVDVFYLDRGLSWKNILHEGHYEAGKYCYLIIGTILAATCTPVTCS